MAAVYPIMTGLDFVDIAGVSGVTNETPEMDTAVAAMVHGETGAGSGEAEARLGDSDRLHSGQIDSGRIDSGRIDSAFIDSGCLDAARLDSACLDLVCIDAALIGSAVFHRGADVNALHAIALQKQKRLGEIFAKPDLNLSGCGGRI